MPVGEFELIKRYFAGHSARADVLLGIGDDAAVLDVQAGRKLVVAMDTIVEDVHFPASISAADIGYRALAVNLSDIAAMGAHPSWFTLSLSLPRSDTAWLEAFASGMFELARQHNVVLVGGDTVRGPLVITVQIAGWVAADRWLTRAGASVGDAIMVSGVLGEAAAGLATLQQNLPESQAVRHLRQRFLRPTPRIEMGCGLRTEASAAMDVSDGLLTDLDKLCAASGCGAEIDVDRLPKSQQLSAIFDAEQCIDFALSGGDDYELLFAVPPAHVARAEELGCTRIGVATAEPEVVCRRSGKLYQPRSRGYDHFT